MNNIINTLQDIKGFFNQKQGSGNRFEESPYSQTNIPRSPKINHHIFYRSPTEPPDNKSDSTSIRKSLSNSASFVSPGTLKQINMNFVFDFMNNVLRKFKADLNFLITNSLAISRLQYEPSLNKPELTMIKNILNFESFILHNKKEKPSFYKVEYIINRFKLMMQVLEETTDIISKENLSKSLAFFDEPEFQKCLLKHFPQHLFEKEYFLLVCCELYRFIRNEKFADPTQTNIQTSFDNLKLFLYGIRFPTPYAEDYPLHHAVYTSNLTLVRRICAREKSPVFHVHIEQSDPAGITPLMLAVLLGNKDAVLILTNHGAHPKHRSFPYARTPLEEAIHRKNRAMIKILLMASINVKQSNWEDNKDYLIEFLKKVPDFSFEMSWECDSKIIPFVKKVTPSDTYKVYKRGSSIRIDLSLLGWSKLKSIRGNSSIIFNGTGAEEGKLLMIDHIKKNSIDILADVNSLVLENKVDELIKHEQMHSEVKAENVVFKPATSWRGENIKSNINGYDCTKCIAKGTFSLLFTKRNVLSDIDARQFEKFDSYFDFVLKQPLWILEDNKAGQIDWNQTPLNKIKNFMESYQAIVKTLFEKDGKENTKDSNKNSKAMKEVEKMNLSQKKLLKNYTKNIVATIYMCDNLPLNLDHFFPILEILSNVSPHINRLKRFLERTLTISRNSFPLKAQIPIFFSLNANLSIKGFNFKSPEASLFNIEAMTIQKKFRKVPDFVYREERFRTEGGSDDEHAQQRWQELLKNDSEDDITLYGPSKFDYKEEGSDNENEESIEGVERNQQFMQSFFKKRGSLINKDLVNVFIPEADEENEGDDLDDFDINEKYRDETLKMSSHGTPVPKTITFLQEKFKSPTSSARFQTTENRFDLANKEFRQTSHLGAQVTVINDKKYGDQNISSLKEKNNYKFLGKLNPHPDLQHLESLKANAPSRRESICSRNFNEMDFSENLKEVQMKKLMKYTMKKQTLMSKLNQQYPKNGVKQEKKTVNEPQPQKKIEESNNNNALKANKKIKHERIKSLDFPNKINFETFFDTLWKQTEKDEK